MHLEFSRIRPLSERPKRVYTAVLTTCLLQATLFLAYFRFDLLEKGMSHTYVMWVSEFDAAANLAKTLCLNSCLKVDRNILLMQQ